MRSAKPDGSPQSLELAVREGARTPVMSQDGEGVDPPDGCTGPCFTPKQDNNPKDPTKRPRDPI